MCVCVYVCMCVHTCTCLYVLEAAYYENFECSLVKNLKQKIKELWLTSLKKFVFTDVLFDFYL